MSAIIRLCAEVVRNPYRVDVDKDDDDRLVAQAARAKDEFDDLVATCVRLLLQLEHFKDAAIDARFREKDDGDAIAAARATLGRIFSLDGDR